MTVAFGVVFALGVALGQVTTSDAKPGAAQTRVRTVVPVGETVTVTRTVSTGP